MQVHVQRLREISEGDVSRFLPKRERETHKGNYGRILMLCGSTGFTGAAKLAAAAAMRCGSGLVYLGVPASVYPIIASGLTEPVVFPLPDDENGRLSEAALAPILERLPQMDAVLAGPGLGQSDGVFRIICALLENASQPLILDADGINVLRGHIDILRAHRSPVILTPHDGEFSRLYDGPLCGRYQETVLLAKETGCVVLRKGAKTLISDGSVTYRNRTGNPGMAKGGSGDVLSGIIASLLGQDVPPLEAAALGAWIHGSAGDLCAKQLGEYGMLPSDMVDALPAILMEK